MLVTFYNDDNPSDPEVIATMDLEVLPASGELVEFETSVSEYVWRVRTVKHHLHSYGKAYSISLSRERRISPRRRG